MPHPPLRSRATSAGTSRPRPSSAGKERTGLPVSRGRCLYKLIIVFYHNFPVEKRCSAHTSCLQNTLQIHKVCHQFKPYLPGPFAMITLDYVHSTVTIFPVDSLICEKDIAKAVTWELWRVFKVLKSL